MDGSSLSLFRINGLDCPCPWNLFFHCLVHLYRSESTGSYHQINKWVVLGGRQAMTRVRLSPFFCQLYPICSRFLCIFKFSTYLQYTLYSPKIKNWKKSHLKLSSLPYHRYKRPAIPIKQLAHCTLFFASIGSITEKNGS